MNCEEIRSLYSQRFDGELPAAALKSIEDHCELCTACADAWWDFERSTQALRGLEVSPVSDDYVDSIVAAAVGAQVAGATVTVTPAGRRPYLSHTLALLAGAALVLLFLWIEGSMREGSSTQSVPTGTQAHGRWSLQRGSGTLVRADQQRAQDAGPVALASGDHLVVAPGSQLAFQLPEGGTIEIESPQVELPEPRIEIVERVVPQLVTQVEYVYVTIPAVTSPTVTSPTVTSPAGDGHELERALTFLGQAFLQMRDAFDERATHLAETTAPAPGGGPAQRDEPVAPRLARRGPAIASALPATVVVQRRGDLFSLETRGSLEEVVPALIARIDDENSAVSELVQQRLREIWADRTGRNVNEAPLAVAQADEEFGRFGWKRWMTEDPRSSEAVDPTTFWTTWWSEEQGLIALAGM